jgi:hypothetical protein
LSCLLSVILATAGVDGCIVCFLRSWQAGNLIDRQAGKNFIRNTCINSLIAAEAMKT